MSGFISIHRSMLDHPLFDGDSARIGAWVWLLARACWKPTPFDITGKMVTLERGQLCASRAQLAKAWGWSPSAVERFLTRLKTEQMIGQDTGQGRSIITICNYDKYQHADAQAGQDTGQPTGQRSDSHRTTKEQGNKGIRVDTNVSTKSAREKKPAFVLPLDIPADAWEGFEEMRRNSKKPLTDRARSLAVTELRKLAAQGHSPEGVLNQSTMNSWQGLFPIKDNGGNGNGRSGNGGSQHSRGNGFFNAVYDEVSKRYQRGGTD